MKSIIDDAMQAIDDIVLQNKPKEPVDIDKYFDELLDDPEILAIFVRLGQR